ncbi:MAG TPA: sigma-70 family RNA polymerase sigma factor [Clostridiales bacterium]|jgi:RNA polymerase sigma-70 factor, ECF subfamily|nr:sigma-70 family RNA polymerase sigma factor [Clostridiales bacterium]HQP69514.1 sigma-70 family RNA polymerase sigma factor [Clostridiales bacterium]
MKSDKELLDMYVKRGDSLAFEKFFDRYKDKLYGFICGKTYPDFADDIFQETFRKFINALFEREIDKPKSYLFAIAMNVISSRVRDKFKDSISYAEEIDYEGGRELPEDISDFETEFDKKPNLEKLKTAMKKLSEKKNEFHTILHLHVYSGFSFSEIAEIKKLSRNTVTGRYLYAVKYLKQYYEEA